MTIGRTTTNTDPAADRKGSPAATRGVSRDRAASSPRSLEFAHQLLDILQFLAQQIELARHCLDLGFGAPVDRVIQLAAQAVLDVLPVLVSHDYGSAQNVAQL